MRPAVSSPPPAALVLRLLPSILLLPVSALLLFLSYCYHYLGYRNKAARRTALPNRKTVLITGADTPTGLALARLFYRAGHKVVGADVNASVAPFSASIADFYRLPAPRPAPSHLQKSRKEQAPGGERAPWLKWIFRPQKFGVARRIPYSMRVSNIIGTQEACLWILCDHVTQQEHAEQTINAWSFVDPQRTCAFIHPPKEVRAILEEPTALAAFVNGLEGTHIRAPKISRVFSRAEIHRALGASPKGTKFVLEEEITPERAALMRAYDKEREKRDSGIGGVADDDDVEDVVNEESRTPMRITLPMQTMNETYTTIAELKISKQLPWIMREVVEGEEYAAHVLVVNGELKAFVVSKPESLPAVQRGSPVSRKLLTAGRNHAEIHVPAFVTPDSAFHATLLGFTQTLVSALPDSHGLSTHLTLTFRVSSFPTPTGTAQTIFATSCSTAASPTLASLLQLSRTPETAAKLVAAYLSAVPTPTAENGKVIEPAVRINGHREDEEGAVIFLPEAGVGTVYALPVAVRELLILPIVEVLLWRRVTRKRLVERLREVVENVVHLINLIAFGKEELFELEDPWPALLWWHVVEPMRLLKGVWRGGEVVG
ncbi:hypothetical protein W97_05023 [Coniosporium apollinis CBS 100218]|uniref:Uncharacterized protein n=1 Tax=Coniosporium apollinis (strain CBS 100218) TaxID=1168221 RepID=R7YVE6_CONA1|nr:uncharacterized protein W97_05023 [Coniosporium apollinis CBS 100218]EON65784.1 hypothetical protein W97_05023 [Coniosporium apollinis CBS 100218]